MTAALTAAITELDSRPRQRLGSDEEWVLCPCGAGVADFRIPQHAARCAPLAAYVLTHTEPSHA